MAGLRVCLSAISSRTAARSGDEASGCARRVGDSTLGGTSRRPSLHQALRPDQRARGTRWIPLDVRPAGGVAVGASVSAGGARAHRDSEAERAVDGLEMYAHAMNSPSAQAPRVTSGRTC